MAMAQPKRSAPSSDKTAGRPRATLPGRFHRADLRLLAWVMIVLNLVLCWALLASPGGLRGYLQKRRDLTRLERKLDRLARRNRDRFAEIEQFRRDPRVQEKMVRERLGWVKTGETVIEFAPQSPAP